MPSVGIDISDQAIRFVEIVHSESGKQKFHLKAFGEKKLPVGVVAGEFISKPENVKEILTDIHKKNGHKFACVSLPEEKGYLFKIDLPNIDKKYFSENIEFRLEENVPLDAAKSVFDYNVISSHDATRLNDAVVTVVQNKVIDFYSELFNSAGFAPVSYELVTQAVARAVVPRGETETCLIIYIGNSRAGFGIVSDGALQFTSTVNIGNAVDDTDVEKKRSMIKDEVAKLNLYWQSHVEKDELLIKKVILSGRGATESGLKEYLAEAAACQVILANVWVNVFNFEEQIPEISFEDSLDYAPAIGLALSRFYHA